MDIGLRWVDGVPGAALALFLPLGALGGQLRASTIYAQAAPSQLLILSERVDIFPDGVRVGAVCSEQTCADTSATKAANRPPPKLPTLSPPASALPAPGAPV